jgi:hypothetical protein
MAASADARISTGLPSHPKTLKLIKRLGQAGAWNLISLFLHTAQYKSNGDLSGMSDEDIELAAGWTGDDGVFVRTLQDVRFLDGAENARRIHDWADHNPWAAGAPARSEKSRFAALTKQYGRGEAERQMPEYAERIRPAAGDGAKGKEKSATEDAKPVPDESNGTATGLPVAVPDSASGSATGTNGECPVSDTVSVTVTVSDSLPSEEQKLQDSLRSSSPTASPPAPPAAVETEEQKKLRKAAEAADRLAVHTRNAMAAYNDVMAAPNGLLSRATEIGLETKRDNVKRCITVAKQISKSVYGTDAITPEFWREYFLEAAKDPFKAGRSKGSGRKHEGWVPDFEYLTRKDVMVEVFEKAMSEVEA